MEIGAVITAAGMSSRMGEFKPMLSIGTISIAQRVTATLRQAGAEKMVMVTGNNAEELERHLSKSRVIFLRNENYASTQMFDSAKIGLEYLRGKCDVVLFTPVGIAFGMVSLPAWLYLCARSWPAARRWPARCAGVSPATRY